MGSCKSRTRFIPATFAWLLLLVATGLFFVYPGQYLQRSYHFSIIIFQGVITVFVVSNFFLATFMDPGIIPRGYWKVVVKLEKDEEDDFKVPLYRTVQVNQISIRLKWCTTCKFYRPPRCSHCSVCNSCIETFDHHCPWVNNCIGRRNYRHFFFFLVFLSIHMMTVLVWCMLYVKDHKDDLRDTEGMVCLGLMGLILLLLIPIIGLTGFHMVLVGRGRTTNEQVTGKFHTNISPFSRGVKYNCLYTLFGPNYPHYRTSGRNQRHRSKSFRDYNYAASTNKDNVVKVFIENNEKNSNAKNLPTQFVASKSNDNGNGKLASGMVIHSF